MIRVAWALPVALAAVATFCVTAAGQDLQVENELVRLAISPNGVVYSLLDKSTASEWLAPRPRVFSSVRKGGKYFAAISLVREGDLWRAGFGEARVQADFRITPSPHYVLFELVKVRGEGVEEVRFGEMRVACTKNSGSWLNVWWDEQFAVALLGLSDRVHVQFPALGVSVASVYPEFGMEGQRAVLVAAPTPQFLDVVQEVERDFGLPSPRLDGQWAKTSQAVRTGYLFTDLTESNADETIRFAKLGGFGYIMTYSDTWSTSHGSYPINTRSFPQGEASLKATVDKCHAAGLRVGLHCLTSFVGKNDPLVRPQPDSRLLKDDQATLAADIDEKATEVAAAGPLTSFPTEGAFYGDDKAGFDIQIDDELIQYRAIGGEGKNVLLQCTRGYTGTLAAPHKAGAKIHHLVERYGCYLADLRTTLKGEISDRLAGVINRCGFDMVYFDGGECNAANGPFWYWVTQQQDDLCRRVTRELLVQGSGGTAWTWHWFARGCCDDFAAIAPKQYLDYHKIADSWMYYMQSFVPADLGWWGFLADAPDHPATMPDEEEYYAARMLALDTPVSLETNLGALKQNGRTEEMLARLGEYERLRLSGTVPASVREKLRTGEWRLVQSDGKPAMAPVRYDVHRVDVPGETTVTNTFGAQPLQFRLHAMPTLAPAGDKANIVLLHAEPATELPLPAANAPMPGAVASGTEFTKPMDLLHHRALAVRIRVDGAAPAARARPAVLNIQLEAAGKTYRDHYIDLDFTGEKTIVLSEPTTERMLPEFRPAQANYAFKAAMYGFSYGHIVALNLRWMRLPASRPPKCTIATVEALAESEMPLKHPEIELAGKTLAIPVDLNPGDYAEFRADGRLRIFDRNGMSLASIDIPSAPPTLDSGETRLALRAGTPSPVKLTVITAGPPLSW